MCKNTTNTCGSKVCGGGCLASASPLLQVSVADAKAVIANANPQFFQLAESKATPATEKDVHHA